MGIFILYPSAAGDETNIDSQTPGTGEHWDKLLTDDEFTTTVNTDSATLQRDLYTIDKITVPIESITEIWFYTDISGDGGTGTAARNVAYKTHGTVYEAGGLINIGGTWRGSNVKRSTNPYTGTAWTLEEVRNLQIGVSLRGNGTYSGFVSQVHCTVYATELTPGHYWSEGDKFHFISEVQEQKILGADTTTNATPGHYWVEGEYYHYISENGDERRQLGYDTGATGTVPGTRYIDDFWVYYISASGKVRKLGTWMLGSSTLGVDTILHS